MVKLKKIFVSSTFKDMHYERDILHTKVIPELNALARQNAHEEVFLCDLRWGVNTSNMSEEESSKKVLKTCLDEIDSCRPYMIVILGDRYGYTPEPEYLEDVIKDKKTLWQYIDSNYKDKISVTELEIIYGALSNEEQLKRTLFYFREAKYNHKYSEVDEENKDKLISLKSRIVNINENNCKIYNVSFDKNNRMIDGLDDFAKIVYRDLKNLLGYDEVSIVKKSIYESTQYVHWLYAERKAQIFTGRKNLINYYLDLIENKNIFIKGNSGIGKSSIIAKLASILKEKEVVTIPVFLGLTSNVTTIRGVIEYLCGCFKELFIIKKIKLYPDEIEASLTFEKCVDIFYTYIKIWDEYSDERIIILLDAIDQLLPDNDRDSFFTPHLLQSKKVRLVLSGINMVVDTESYTALKVGTLTINDKQDIIANILQKAGKELESSVVEYLLKKEKSNNPYYLTLMMIRLIMIGRDDYNKISGMKNQMEAINNYQKNIINNLPNNINDMCYEIILLASQKLGYNGILDDIKYIALSRFGLRESDIVGIMKMKGKSWSASEFALLRKYLNTFFFLRNDGRYDLTHKIIRECLKDNISNSEELHEDIFRYFRELHDDNIASEELIWHCINANAYTFFIQYISDLYIKDDEYNKKILDVVANSILDYSEMDKGKWITNLISIIGIKEDDIFKRLLIFLRIKHLDDNKIMIDEQTIYYFIKFFNDVLVPKSISRCIDEYILERIYLKLSNLAKDIYVYNVCIDNNILQAECYLSLAKYMVKSLRKYDIYRVEENLKKAKDIYEELYKYDNDDIDAVKKIVEINKESVAAIHKIEKINGLINKGDAQSAYDRIEEFNNNNIDYCNLILQNEISDDNISFVVDVYLSIANVRFAYIVNLKTKGLLADRANKEILPLLNEIITLINKKKNISNDDSRILVDVYEFISRIHMVQMHDYFKWNEYYNLSITQCMKNYNITHDYLDYSRLLDIKSNGMMYMTYGCYINECAVEMVNDMWNKLIEARENILHKKNNINSILDLVSDYVEYGIFLQFVMNKPLKSLAYYKKAILLLKIMFKINDDKFNIISQYAKFESAINYDFYVDNNWCNLLWNIYNNILLIWKNKNELLYKRYLEYQKKIPNYQDIENRACEFRKIYEALNFLANDNSIISIIQIWRVKTWHKSNNLDCNISNYEDLNQYIGEAEAGMLLVWMILYSSKDSIPKCLEKYFTKDDILKIEKEYSRQIVFDDSLYI